MFNVVAAPANLGTWRAALRSARVWLFSRPDAASDKSQRMSRRVQPASAARPVFVRLSAAEQWERVTGVLTRSNGQARQAREFQGRALQQIDLATYAFNSIVDELATVMALPARREPVVVHLFEPALARSKERGAVAVYRAA